MSSKHDVNISNRAWAPTTVVLKRTAPVPNQITEAEVRAIANVYAGEASPHDQQLAMKAIIYGIARADDLGYYPDELGGERDSAFAQGSRHVGLQVRKFALHAPTYLSKDTDVDNVDPKDLKQSKKSKK